MNKPATAPPPTLAASLQALVKLVDDDRERQLAQILGDARTRGAALRRQAHEAALARLRQAFAEQRQARKAQLAAARARLQTQQRLHEQQRSSALLALAWQQLPPALRARWALPELRAAWVARVLDAAHQRLPPAGWQLQHAAGWTDAEQARATAALAERGHADVQLALDPALDAGLKVMAGGNLIDGTLRGLLADRAEIDAALLRRLETPT